MDPTSTPTPTAPATPAPAAAEASAPPAPPAPAPAAPEAPAPAPAEAPPSIPSPDDFKWDEWDGEDFDAFAEPVRPWVKEVHGRFKPKLTEYEKKNKYLQSILDARKYGEEDPRIAEASQKYQEYESKIEELNNLLETKTTEFEKAQEAQDEQYMRWFQQSHGDKMEQAVKNYGNDVDKATEVMFGLMEDGLEAHSALEVMLLGEKAIEDARRLSKKITDPDILVDYIQRTHKAQEPEKPSPAAPAAPRQQPPAASLVNGASGPTNRAVTPKEEPQKFTSEKDMIRSIAQSAMKRSRS